MATTQPRDAGLQDLPLRFSLENKTPRVPCYPTGQTTVSCYHGKPCSVPGILRDGWDAAQQERLL